MKKLKHNKFKNTGVIYAVLTKVVMNEVLNKKPTSTGLRIIKKYFTGNSELAKELRLYNVIQEINTKTTMPDKILDMIIEKRKSSIDRGKLATEKFNLIGEMTNKLGSLEEIFSTNVYNYKVLASVYKLFEYDAMDNPVDYVTSRKFIIENFESKPTITEAALLSKSSGDIDEINIRKIALKIAVDKFNEKYQRFNTRQKTLLRKFMTESATSPKFKNYLYEEVGWIKSALVDTATKLTDPVLRIKVNECINLIDKINAVNEIHMESIGTLLKYYELIDELGSK